jgi:uncharacterized surface protein with fasciclin (FAS1) repeats
MKKLTALFATFVASASMVMAADDIVATAKSTGMHNTLVKAIDAAGLTETLQGKGPFTVFAPTDDAFKKVPAEKLNELLKPENKEKLATLLKNHVVAGKVESSDVKTGEVSAVGGAKLDVKASGGKVQVENANVTKADVKATNGVIHVVDSVVMPN